MTATEPTPPDAPVTKTSPESGVRSFISNFLTHSPAVNPAVPIDIASASVNSLGRGMAQLAGIEIY